MRKFLLVISAITIQSFCVAQTNNKYDLILSAGSIPLEANFQEARSQKSEQANDAFFKGVYYRYLQFTSLPTAEQKIQLDNLGIKLMLYLPTNTFMAAIK